MRQGWEIKKLGEVAIRLFAGGDKPQTFSEYKTENLKVPVYANGVSNEGLVGYTDNATVKEKSITISARGTIGFCCIRRIPFVPIVRLITVIPIKNVKSEYLYYVLSNTKIENNGVAVPQLTVPMIKELPIPVPPLAEQKRIVAELDCLNGIIEKKKEQLKELDLLAQSIFYTMFGDPITNEKGWEVKCMEDLFDICSSKRVFESQWTNQGIPFYRAREIVRLSKGEPIDDPIFISMSLYNEYSKKYGVPTKGDIMVTAVGTLGICYLVNKATEFYFKDGNILWFKNKGLCNPRFIKDQYATDFVIEQIKGNANAAVVGTYTIMNARKTKVVVPPIALQNQYIQKIEAIEKQKGLIKQSIAETEMLFNSRMDYYFN